MISFREITSRWPLSMDDKKLTTTLRTLLKMSAETEWVEFKEGNCNPEEIGEYLSALSNSAGLHDEPAAYLVWGVQNATHQLVGTDFAPRSTKVKNQELENWLACLLEPRINFTISEFSVNGKGVVMFEIQPCEHTPVRWKETAYIRVGTYKKKLRDHPEKERALWLRSSRLTFESLIAARDVSSEDTLAMIDYPSYFEMSGQSVPSSRSSILERLQQEKIIQPSATRAWWDITNLGALLFARKLTDFPALARKAVRVIVYRGKDRTQTMKENSVPRGYAAGFEELVSYINNQLPSNEEIGSVFRHDVRMYPEIAIRELVANAIVHQDLTINGVSPMVEIFPDRVEITNPGKPLIEPLRFIDEPPQSRNEDMAALLRRLKICEERGSGIDKVVLSIEIYQLPAPEFRVNGHTISTLFAYRRLNEMGRVDKVRACYQHACLRYVSREIMTNASFRKRLGIEDQNYAIASRIIADAIEEGLVKPRDPDNTSRKHASYVPFWA